MGDNIVDLEARRIAPHLISLIEQFLIDPPDTDFQLGYLAGLLALYCEGLGRGRQDARIIAAERLVSRAMT